MKPPIITLAAATLFMASPALAQDRTCQEYRQFAAKVSATLPTRIDEYTMLRAVDVNCESKVLKMTKDLTVPEDDMAVGWRERKQWQHTQLNCYKEGTASKARWTAVDEIYDNDGNLLVTLQTQPSDCN